MVSSITLTTLRANSTNNNLMIFFYFRKQGLAFHANCLQKTGFNISRKLSLKETICMKCQTLFSAKKSEKYFIMSSVDFFFVQLARVVIISVNI